MTAAPKPPQTAPDTRTWPAALALFFGAGLIPETVATFNTPPLRLLTSPFSFMFMSAFYGSAALLVREFLRRRAAGWTTVLLLGMAAGAINEGIIAGTWYKVQYPGYALIGGVDPAAALGLTIFHALVSTVLPILLAELAFPRLADRGWLRPSGLTGCLLLLAITTASGFGPAADRGPRLAVLAGVVVTVALAVTLPGARPRSGGAARGPVPVLARLRLAGAMAAVAFYAIFAVAAGLIAARVPPPGRTPWQLLLVILMAVFFAVVIRTGRDWTGRAGWGPPQTLAVITGVLLPAIAASLILPAALEALEPLVTVPVLVMLGRLHRRQAAAGLLSGAPRPGQPGTGSAGDR